MEIPDPIIGAVSRALVAGGLIVIAANYFGLV
jgi:hypothetical protein